MINAEKLKQILNSFEFEEKNTGVIKNAVLDISIPHLNFQYHIVYGIARADSDDLMNQEHQFHIASITKTMTATLILQLYEKGIFGPKGLDTTLAELSVFPPKVLDRLHVKNKINYGSNITLRQLLSHTSGLKDPYSDDANGIATDYDNNIAPGSIAALWQSELESLASGDASFDKQKSIIFKNWIPWDKTQPYNMDAGMLNYYINTLGNSPVSLPGEVYHYSDTGFVMLALIAEKLGNKSYHKLLRENIFDPSEMNSTYLAYANDPKPDLWVKEISDCYAGDFPMVTGGFNFSFDWGGGGVVSTAGDLNKFLEALINDNLFVKAETLKEMLDFKIFHGLEESGTEMGLGIFAEENKKNKTILWGHDGAWGSGMYYEPANGIYISGTINQLLDPPSGWFDNLLGVLHNAILEP